MPIPISGGCGASPGLAVTIRDATTDSVLVYWPRTAPIVPDETVVIRRDLAGRFMSDQVEVKVSGCSPGSGGSLVDIAPDDQIVIEVRLEDATASSAVAKVPAQEFSVDDTAAWDGDISVQEAEVGDGSARITLRATSRSLTFFVIDRFAPVFGRCPDELPEKGMRVRGTRLELRVELASDEPGMIQHLHYLHQVFFRVDAGDLQSVPGQVLPEGVVEFISVAVAFDDHVLLINIARLGARLQTAFLASKTHRTANI